MLTSLTLLTCLQRPSPNLIRNGSFNSGARYFVSGYRKAEEISMAGTFAVGKDPLRLHGGAGEIANHTSGKGPMLMVNGSTTGGTVWLQRVKVQPGAH